MYLFDTDILIYSLKGHPAVIEKLEEHRGDQMAVSVISLMELYYGAHKSRHREANISKVRMVEDSFDVVPVGVEVSHTFGSLKADMEERGTPLDDFDLILASTALSHNLTLVSNNIKHFRRIDSLSLENWAEGAP